MKLCPTCDLMVAEEIHICPACGGEVGAGRESIDGYTLLDVLHEGYASILCRAVPHGGNPATESVMIRIFTPQSGVNAQIAHRLKRELSQIQTLPEEYFVQHHDICKTSDGAWYRVSEWIDRERWGSLLASGRLQDPREAFRLFYRIASILDGLHRIGHFIPHLILDDIIVYRDSDDKLQVKIDYKLSRFLDPSISRPGPMLKRLLTCHPDIINQRPLDFRTDIWSLGKIFVELLTADLGVCDLSASVDTLPINSDAKILLKIMLAADPDMRPGSMGEVVSALERIVDQWDHPPAAGPLQEPAQARAIRGINRKISFLGIILALVLCTAFLTLWPFLSGERPEDEDPLEVYANRYAPSVAMILVEYWVKADDTTVYLNRSEGTGFLVDPAGYLLTNRHVACPWLEDPRLVAVITRLRELGHTGNFGYRMFLWFEGAQAFRRLPSLQKSRAVEDHYSLQTAYSRDGANRVTIAGVARPPSKTWELVKHPLKNDYALLKIDPVPDGLHPLPLAAGLDTAKVPKLSPVITLGFPLGSRTQGATVNVSVTRGSVRRAFENMLQVDTSIYRGNSGGPVIDRSGKVIGIASSVYMDMASSPIPVATMLSDIGMVLPISRAADFLAALKRGERKWNGVLDLEVARKIEDLLNLAIDDRWAEARRQVLEELSVNAHPELVVAAGMIHFGLKEYDQAAGRFEQALSMGLDRAQVRWMLYIMDWLGDKGRRSPHRKPLQTLDWRSPDEFYGHLLRVLEGDVNPGQALAGGYTAEESSWLHWTAGLQRMKTRDWPAAEKLFETAARRIAEPHWLFPLALHQLRQVRERSTGSAHTAGRTPQDPDSREKTLIENWRTALKAWAHRKMLQAKLRQADIDLAERIAILEQLRENAPWQGEYLTGLAFHHAMAGDWEKALTRGQEYLDIQGRESAGRLSMALLMPEILHIQGRTAEARVRLQQLQRNVQDPWYRALGSTLLGDDPDEPLGLNGRHPLFLVTAHSALGFWAEGDQDRQGALGHYREALASYMDDRLEYTFALERFRYLRESGADKP